MRRRTTATIDPGMTSPGMLRSENHTVREQQTTAGKRCKNGARCQWRIAACLISLFLSHGRRKHLKWKRKKIDLQNIMIQSQQMVPLDALDRQVQTLYVMLPKGNSVIQLLAGKNWPQAQTVTAGGACRSCPLFSECTSIEYCKQKALCTSTTNVLSFHTELPTHILRPPEKAEPTRVSRPNINRRSRAT